ncbi:MAG TPA: hypothetical protein VFT45_10725 [Longimicrobium sp.]|nr:hypothetical protein [Longimicrobium sp.]
MTDPQPAATDERPAHARHGLAGWLVLAWLLATAGRFAWTAWSRFGDAAVPWWSKIATAAVALLALAAVLPLLRFRRSGWEMAVWVLVTAVVMDLALIVLGTRQWIVVAAAAGASAFCLGYLWRARAAFTAHDDVWEEGMDADHPPAVSESAQAAPAAAAHPAADPVADALGAIHRRIVDAGSACATTREALLEIAVRHGLRPEALRREGLSLYRTFVDHFLADGPLTTEEDRELFCLENRLGLDAIAAARLRAEREAADRVRVAPQPVAVDDVSPVIVVETQPVPPVEPEPVDEAPQVTVDEAPSVPVDVAPPVTVVEPEPVPVVETPPPAEAADEAFRDEPAEIAADPTVSITYTPGLAGIAGSAALADYEQHELDALTAWAGVGVPWDREPRPALETLRAFHRISTEPLAEVDPGMPLEEGERCFAVRMVDLYRTAPGAQPHPAGPRSAMDATAFVDGSLERDCDLSRYQRAGGCRFLITDRRLLLVAPSGQQSPLPLDRIRSVKPHRNGLQVHPTRGNPVFLAFSDGVADAAMRIARLLRDARGGRPA